MREIKIRGWQAHSKIMIPHENLECGIKNLNKTGRYNNHHLHFMEFSGLKDKNGKEIYEGDILQFGYPTTSKYDPDDDTFRLPIKVIIDFHGGAFWFTGEGYTDCNWHFYNAEDREIIGNIYENPELL